MKKIKKHSFINKFKGLTLYTYYIYTEQPSLLRYLSLSFPFVIFKFFIPCILHYHGWNEYVSVL